MLMNVMQAPKIILGKLMLSGRDLIAATLGAPLLIISPAYAEQVFDGGLNNVGLAQTLGTIGRQNRLLRFAVRTSRCDAAEASGIPATWCEMPLIDTRVRAWSRTEGGPIFKITARPDRQTSSSSFLLAFQIVVQAVDPDLSDEQAYQISKAMASTGETLSGKRVLDGSTARYRSDVDRDGLIVTITPR